jgi:uncharacterized protein (DUF2147 family)
MRVAKSAVMFGLLIALCTFFVAPPSRASSWTPDGTWIVNDRLVLESFTCKEMLCGRIVWLRDPAMRTPQLCERMIVWNLRRSGPGQWTGGWFYDPENGSTYNISATAQSNGTISARIYEGVAWLGRTEILTRVPRPGSLTGWC